MDSTWLAWAGGPCRSATATPSFSTCHLEGRSSLPSPGEHTEKAAALHSRWSGFLWRCRINYNKRWSAAIGAERSFRSCLPGKARLWKQGCVRAGLDAGPVQPWSTAPESQCSPACSQFSQCSTQECARLSCWSCLHFSEGCPRLWEQHV